MVTNNELDLDNEIANLPGYAPDRSGTNMELHSDGIYVLRSDVQDVLARRSTAPEGGTSSRSDGTAAAGAEDCTVDHRELAGKILSFSGISSRGSMEPGADPLADRLAEKLAGWGVTFAQATSGSDETQSVKVDERALLRELADAADVVLNGGVAGLRPAIDKARAYLATTSSAGIWKLVPVEPTRAMMDAGFNTPGAHMYGASYRAMVAAAPLAQQATTASTSRDAAYNRAKFSRSVNKEDFDAGWDAASDAPAAEEVRDAARYRWLRSRPIEPGHLPVDGDMWVVQSRQVSGAMPELRSAGFDTSLDARIDAAMSASQGKTEEAK